ncbi:formate/nitrite transporter family protein [Arenibaculum sp.]|jgi:formate/nitrite transporter FocA (FNT family)|uniref:formate/nitrite transporter family protein n=1 Tax=Arenibaculum sp. TaxID=2865862 RepID=UPI002E0D64EC|nr:formate/nitrite transporter family protein [Arenibaculum sp.]
MAIAPNPSEIFRRAVKEGERRLDQSLLELTATGFIAGFTIVFGIVALGIVHALVGPGHDGVATIGGALVFGVGVVFLVVGRAELFNENFYEPAATVFEEWAPGKLPRLARLWSVTFVLNLAGGAFFAAILSIEGVLPDGTGHALNRVAEEIVRQEALTAFVKAVAGGALVALLSFLLEAVNHIGSRIFLALSVGFLLALGPFAHVAVAVLHVFFGLLLGAQADLESLFGTMAIATAGNIVGGIGLTTFMHIAQAKGARE